MHELSYCEGVLQAVERRAAGRPVARIGVRIGVVHRVVADAFQQSFELVAAGGVADGAEAELVVVPVQGSCVGCGASFTSADPSPACPHCGSLDVAVEGGDEVILEWLEYRSTLDIPAVAEHADEVVPEHTHVTAGSD